jgi:hypothetical protein
MKTSWYLWPLVIVGLPVSYIRDLRNPDREIH